MSDNLEKAKQVAEETFDLNAKFFDIQETLSEHEEKEFNEWYNKHPSLLKLMERHFEKNANRMKLKPKIN